MGHNRLARFNAIGAYVEHFGMGQNETLSSCLDIFCFKTKLGWTALEGVVPTQNSLCGPANSRVRSLPGERRDSSILPNR